MIRTRLSASGYRLITGDRLRTCERRGPSPTVTAHDVDRRRARREVDSRRCRQLQRARPAMGTPDLCPRVPDDWPRRGCARRMPGNVPPRIPGAPGVSRAGEVLVMAVPHRAESVPRLDPA